MCVTTASQTWIIFKHNKTASLPYRTTNWVNNNLSLIITFAEYCDKVHVKKNNNVVVKTEKAT